MTDYDVFCPHCNRILYNGECLPILFALCAYCGRGVNGGGGKYWKTKDEAEVAETERNKKI